MSNLQAAAWATLGVFVFTVHALVPASAPEWMALLLYGSGIGSGALAVAAAGEIRARRAGR